MKVNDIEEKLTKDKVKVDTTVDRISSGVVGAAKTEKLKKYKGAIMAAVAAHRGR